MTWAMPSGVGKTMMKIAVAGVLTAAPMAAVGVTAYAAPGTPTPPAVLPAPPPADPPSTEAPPPPPAPAPRWEYYNPDQWVFTGDAGAGGGGGGG